LLLAGAVTPGKSVRARRSHTLHRCNVSLLHHLFELARHFQFVPGKQGVEQILPLLVVHQLEVSDRYWSGSTGPAVAVEQYLFSSGCPSLWWGGFVFSNLNKHGRGFQSIVSSKPRDAVIGHADASARIAFKEGLDVVGLGSTPNRASVRTKELCQAM